RRRVARSELLAVAQDADLMDEVIDTFAAYRLLALDHDPASRSPTVEVAHEALLREWDRLRQWLNESRADIRLQRLLSMELTISSRPVQPKTTEIQTLRQIMTIRAPPP
ncbi:MAG TPA: hypothetical protein P5526_25695, partial [Anaerolineae bacterium]|nr:hypothetical protein [Anaerolineae bacterium]